MALAFSLGLLVGALSIALRHEPADCGGVDDALQLLAVCDDRMREVIPLVESCESVSRTWMLQAQRCCARGGR